MSKSFNVKVISPKGIYYEGNADMIEGVSSLGEFGIYYGHEPTAFILSPGIIKIHSNGETKKCMLSTGFAEVLNEKVVIMAEDILLKDEIDLTRAKNALDRAIKRLESNDTNIDVKRAEFAMKKALVRIKLKEE